jgi:hypothetical protein
MADQEGAPETSQDLTIFVQNLLEQMVVIYNSLMQIILHTLFINLFIHSLIYNVNIATTI